MSFLQVDKSAFLHSAIMDQVDVVAEEIKVSLYDYVTNMVTYISICVGVGVNSPLYIAMLCGYPGCGLYHTN